MSDNNAPLLEIKDLVVSFGAGRRKKEVLHRISFDIKEGECLGLVGESGSGKSTVSNAVMHFIPVEAGRILFRGQDITALHGKKLRQMYRDIQMVFQSPDESISPHMKIGRYITEVCENFSLSRSADRAVKARELLRTMGLDEAYADRYPAFLSGGERQRVAIARAVSVLPSLLICDEPTSALDVSVQALIVELLRRLQREHGMTYLFISHDLPLVSHLCQRVVILYQGEIVEILPSTHLAQEARHPYTKKLLSAAFGSAMEKAPAMASLPDCNRTPDGCAFKSECPCRKERCLRERPELACIAPEHQLACFLAEK